MVDPEGEEDGNAVTIRVKASADVGSTASAISHAVYAGKKVTLRCIGAGAVNQAVKAIAIATSFVLDEKGWVLCTRPVFTSIWMPDGQRISAILVHVIVHESHSHTSA